MSFRNQQNGNPANNIQSLISMLFKHLGPIRQRQFKALWLLMLVSAFSEVLSLGMVLPFLGALTSPDRLLAYPRFAEFMQFFGITAPDKLVLPLAIMFACAALFSGAVRLFLLWSINRFSYASGADIGLEIYRKALYQPFSEHLKNNSSVIISGITHRVAAAVNVLLSLLNLANSAVILLTVLFALMIIDPFITALSGLILGGCYVLIVWIFKKRLKHNSFMMSHEHSKMVRTVQEGLGGIRDIILDGSQKIFLEEFRDSDTKLRQAQAKNQFIALGPRYVIEPVGMVFIACLAYYLSIKHSGLISILPVLGTLALGAQRLLPALQQTYACWASIMGNYAALKEVVEVLDQPLSDTAYTDSLEPLVIKSDIRIDSIRFKYYSDSPYVLDGLNFTFEKGSRIGIIGETGSGKSTAMDIFMGLLQPSEGDIFVDGISVTGENLRAWQKTIAHVPQSIYLTDASMAENIAFGVPKEHIDLNRVKEVARRTQIAEFIESGKDGYWAIVGERGVRLSGGQRQRIGIARALYKNASVLVFDEATSALDSETEELVIESINKLDEDLTILIIAHRLSTLENCDIIIEIVDGKIIFHPSYSQLIATKEQLKTLCKSGNHDF